MGLGFRNATFFSILVATSIAACSAEHEGRITSSPVESDASAQLAATPPVQAREFTDRVVGRRWQRAIRPSTEPAPETVIWEFYANGAFRWQLLSDTSMSRAGAWSFTAASASRGMMFLANTSYPGNFEVLSIELSDEGLRLGELNYQAVASVGEQQPSGIREQDRQAVIERRDEMFSSWIGITAAEWRRESGDSSGEPDVYSFAQDAMYTATFNVTACQIEGTWSSSFSEAGRGFIWLSVPGNDCDPRGPRDAYVRELPAVWGGNSLTLNDAVYVPQG